MNLRRCVVWVGGFSLLHLLVHLTMTGVMLALYRIVPEVDRVSLEFFAVYARPNVARILGQFLRGAILAAVFLPFQPVLTRHQHPGILMFAVLWLMNMVGSVEPLPGSIEGIIYTESTAGAHLIIALGSAVQMGILASVGAILHSRLFGRDVGRPDTPDRGIPISTPGMMVRFVLLHVVTYVAAGVIFMELHDYRAAFETLPIFELYRPLDEPLVGLMVMPMQVPRGLLLGLCMAPFIRYSITRPWAWLSIFFLLYGSTALASAGYFPTTVPGLFAGTAPADLFVGTTEITVQMLVFSILLIQWYRVLSRRALREA